MPTDTIVSLSSKPAPVFGPSRSGSSQPVFGPSRSGSSQLDKRAPSPKRDTQLSQQSQQGKPQIDTRSLDKFERRCTKSSDTIVFSPLSKRRLQVLEANQTKLESLTRSWPYRLLNAMCIVLNAIFIAWETEQRASSAASHASQEKIWREELCFSLMATLFCIVFAVELLLRVLAEGWFLFRSREKLWNVFDILVVLTAAIEVVVDWSRFATSGSVNVWGMLGNFSMLRVARLLRVIRATSAVRVIRFIRELRLMVCSLLGALKSLGWAIILLMIILLIFGVFFTDGTVTYCVKHNAMEEESTMELRKYFGTLSSSTVALYMAMSGGEDWATILRPLEKLPGEYWFFFLVFITFAILAVMNVITAVFVETAMQSSQNDREAVVQQELEHKGELIAIMQQVFAELDTNNSGALSLNEFEQHIEDEKILAYLSTLELDVNQVRTLFLLLDVDQTGEVDLEEFVNGCLRLKGGAKSLDMAILKYQAEWMVHNLLALQKLVGERLPGLPRSAQTPM